MALFSRIFQGRKNRSPTVKWYTSDQEQIWNESTFSQSRVRLVIFRDQDFKGRGLLFDSKAVHRVSETEQVDKNGSCKFGCSSRKPPPGPPDDGSTAGNTGPKYTFSRPGSDTKMLEEMVFGAVGMAFRGSSLKVHTIRSPAQLMLTKVFVPVLNRTRESGVEGGSLDLSLNCGSTELTSPQKITDRSPRASSNMAQSVPMDVPSPPHRGYDEYEMEDSGFSTSTASSLSSFAASLPRSSSSSSLTSNSLSSVSRRWRRNQQTSLEHNILKRQSDEGVCDQPVPLAKRPPKIGMAIIIYLPEASEEASKTFQEFFFSHIMLIEGLVNKLKVGVERALSNRKLFVHMTVEVLETFRQLIEDLYLAPRLEEPVWLHMMCYSTRRVTLCQRFLRELMSAVSKYDTKSSKFFLSSLITGVLTHHLAWVPTVTPAGASPSRSYLDKHSAKWLDAVAKSHPYNPLWAQLGDLYGAIGYPVRLSRTVVVGRKPDLVNKILYILSYFIRCSEVLERTEQPHDFDDFKVEEDAPELSVESNTWSDRDSASQTSVCESETRSVCTSAGTKTSELMSDGCNQCQANREHGIDLFGDVTRDGMTSQSHSPLGSEGAKVRLKKQDVNSRSRKETKMPNDPGGGVLEDGFNLDVISPHRRISDYVNSVQNHVAIDENDNHPLEEEFSNDCDLSLTYPGAVIDKLAGDRVLEEFGTFQTEQTSCDNKSAVLNLPLQHEAECRISPTRVNEQPSTTNIRHVGRDAGRDFFPSTDREERSSEKLRMGRGSEDGLQDLEEKIRVEERVEYSQDSGMYDTEVGTAQKQSEWTVGDGGLDLSSNTSNHPQNSKHSPALPQGSTDVNCGDKQSVSSPAKPVGLNRGTSMFDEYFTEESEPVSLVRTHKRTNSGAERYKRMASIEGSSSIFDEYMNIPGVDISARLSEISDSSHPSPRDVDTNVGIFDDYFTDSEKVNIAQEEESTLGGQSTMEVEGPETVREKQSVHLAERRNVKRPDSLLVKPLHVDKNRPRQYSGQSTATVTGPKTRSATPTEFNRRRHASNLSTTSSIEADVFQNLKEVTMPGCELLSAEVSSTPAPKRSFSHSLLARFSPHYLSDFVLHGTSDNNFQAKLHNDLTMSVQNSVLDEPIAEAACVVADMDHWSVKLLTCHYERPDRVRTQEVVPSPLICNILESVHDLWKLKMSPEFCLMHLEDRLQEVFFKSRTLAEYIRCHKRIDIHQIATVLKFDYNDIPLLLAVAGTHTHHRNMALL